MRVCRHQTASMMWEGPSMGPWPQRPRYNTPGWTQPLPAPSRETTRSPSARMSSTPVIPWRSPERDPAGDLVSWVDEGHQSSIYPLGRLLSPPRTNSLCWQEPEHVLCPSIPNHVPAHLLSYPQPQSFEPSTLQGFQYPKPARNQIKLFQDHQSARQPLGISQSMKCDLPFSEVGVRALNFTLLCVDVEYL